MAETKRQSNPDDARARIMFAAPDLLAVVKSVEWASYQQGPGSGYMDSGNDGAWVAACPVCKGINPADPGAGSFVKAVHGHRPTCKLAKALSKATNK